MSYYLRRVSGNLWCGGFSSLPEEKVLAAVSARLGGISKGEYRALNLAFHVGDDAAAVRQNRQLFCRNLFVDANSLVSPEQVHGDKIRRVTVADAGKGAMDYATAIPACDALITNEKNLPLMLCFADCVPLLFYDEEHEAIGIAHAGRKGTELNIAAKTVAAMEREFDCSPDKISVAIAPAIGKSCYEVTADCAAAFSDFADCVTMGENGKAHLDLPGINYRQLLSCGVKPEHIDTADVCTACEHGWYFSYRADGKITGRMGVLMMLKQGTVAYD